jgi:hypothetical protein
MTPMAHMSLRSVSRVYIVSVWLDLHRFPVASFSKNLRRHVAWCTTCRCQDVKLLLVHYARKSKISDKQIGVVLWCAEEQVLGLQVAMHDAVVVQIGDSGEGSPDEVGSIGLVVVSFAADAVEQLASQSKISDQVDCSELAVASRRISFRVRLFMVSK